MNLVVGDFEAAVAHFERVYGAEFLADLPSAEFHACLLGFGGGMFELFAPNAWLLSARFGPFHLGVEYQADMNEVRDVLASHDVRLIRDLGKALHTHPDDTLGVSFEFYGLQFTEKVFPELGRPMAPPSFWRNEHPLGLSRLKGFAIAVDDIDAALARMSALFDCTVLGEETRPALGARAICLDLADSRIELVAPEREGALTRFLARYGQGIHSTIFAARDLDLVRDWFDQHGILVGAGSCEGRLSIPSEANAGAIFEIEAER
ncbi:VOC family protein [Novosphingobium malaysiense]|uniref:VOC domain-containing protein n=1 Tax=Novosphingobium malaysiense TaxID=1348853 RepID=A0A0B1ZH34_9SPHN|nr:VOC family protein [Novosphingobium malaysiense]KHK90421.1 hypothetical protein LK12_17765 [Novosphingobium malaysiense]